MHLWIDSMQNQRYPQKFKFFGSYPCRQDISNRGWPTYFTYWQVLDISTQSEVIHRWSVHLLLPTILIKNEKEQLKSENQKDRQKAKMTCKCLSDLEKISSAGGMAVQVKHMDWKHSHSLKNLCQPEVIPSPNVMHRKLLTAVHSWGAEGRSRNLASFKKIQRTAKSFKAQTKLLFSRFRKHFFSLFWRQGRPHKRWQLSNSGRFARQPALRGAGCAGQHGTGAGLGGLNQGGDQLGLWQVVPVPARHFLAHGCHFETGRIEDVRVVSEP